MQAKTLAVWAVGAAVWSGAVAQVPSPVSPLFWLSFGSQCLAIPRQYLLLVGGVDKAILRHSRAEWREESFRCTVELCCAVSKRLGIIVFTQVDNSCKKQETRGGKGRALGKQTIEKGWVKTEDSHKL